ncbi:MAG: 50S ribosomal protein L37ae [Thermoplasmata archaeon]|nr:50S ribosomal protein L37ae [Thermoplasmata archaeon]
MSRGTKKVGMTGKYGPRYGVKIRKRIKSVSRHRARPQRCPECNHDAVKRVSSGVWHCRHCDLKFAASAYSIRTRSYKKDEAKVETDRFLAEDSEDMGEEVPTEEETLKEPKPEAPVVKPTPEPTADSEGE